MAASRQGGDSTSRWWLSWECGTCWLGQGTALGAGEGAVSAGRKEPWWELLTRQGVRGLAAAQARWHKSQVENARISHECAPALLLLGLCSTHPVIQLPWRLLAPRTSFLSLCKLSLRAHKETWALL